MRYKIFNNSDAKNQIPPKIYKIIYKLIIENYGIRAKLNKEELKKIDKITAYNNWVNMIFTTKDYYITVFFDENKIIGFIAFMYDKRGLCLSEVQINKDYQGKNNNLRKMIKIVLDNCEKQKSKKIYVTINPKNTKSINVFTHIGFCNTEGKIYEITYNNLQKWLDKNN